MNFKDYINSLPNARAEEINKIAEITCSSRISVYRWMNGGTVPRLKKAVIASHVGIPVEELFPVDAPELETEEKGGEQW